MSPSLVHLAIATPATLGYGEGKQMRTAIRKRGVESAWLDCDGFDGDDVANHKYHGGPDRAVCCYPFEHYGEWQKAFGRPLDEAAFGENLTLAGMTEDEVCIGDVFRIGEAAIQITQGRTPCHTIERRTGMNGLVQRFVESGRTGYLCRVLEAGHIECSSRVTCLERDAAGVSVLDAHRLMFRQIDDGELRARLLGVAALAAAWRDKIERQLSP